MRPAAVSRPDETRAVANLLKSASSAPSALVVEGDPGIGKTTLWLDAVEQARERGFHVLSARPAENESVLAYSSLADLLSLVEGPALEDLPDHQRLALDHVLLRAENKDAATDLRTVAAVFLSVVEILADATPVLLAIDDLQWVDPSTIPVVAFAARRLSGPVGILGTVRTDVHGGSSASWLQLTRPEAIERIRLGPMSLGALHKLVRERLGRSFTRPTMVRVQEISDGNPFYALELARTFGADGTGPEVLLPRTLGELVHARIGSLEPDADRALFAAACLAAPTVEQVALATDTEKDRVVRLLDDAQDKGIVVIEGMRLRFIHPLLAHDVYTRATAAQRRAMHRRLAELVKEPELQARHLALAATSADDRTLESLDSAAEMARSRGAPAAAAELLELAIGLGGDTPQRRIQAAGNHFNAGDMARAQTVLEETTGRLSPGPLMAEALSLLAAVRLLDGSFPAAVELLKRVLDESGDNLALSTQTLVTLSFAQLNAGLLDDAAHSIDAAVKSAAQLGNSHPHSQALGMRVMVGFMRGNGFDESGMRKALDLEDREAPTPVTFRPSMLNAMLLAWTGQLDQARDQMLSIQQHCVEHGEESELMFVAVHRCLVEIWRGQLADAALIAEDAMERAIQLAGDLPLSVALMLRSAVAAYTGRVDEARADAQGAIEASRRCGSTLLAEWPITILGFLDVSLGNHHAALEALEPMLATLNPPPKGTEIFVATFVPDAVEAMVNRAQLADAEPLIDMLERNGRTVDRAWMLAVGARCRGMLLAARGDLDAALISAERAMTEHDRMPMPFERARTQLLLGQLQRRLRRRDASIATLREALASFENMNTPLWAGRVRAELGRTEAATGAGDGLSPSEERVAKLAASGMTNREVAATLFISPKTVEANLARIYRKLNIRSRAELGRRMGDN